jgi:hypothetical protein
MARITIVSLSLVTEENNTTVTVDYLPVFTELEVFLMNHGLRFRERIVVVGVDDPQDENVQILARFPTRFVTPPVPHDGGVQLIQRRMVVQRSALQEDEGIGDADEIRCRIRLLPVGMPHIAEAFTETHVLLG